MRPWPVAVLGSDGRGGAVENVAGVRTCVCVWVCVVGPIERPFLLLYLPR